MSNSETELKGLLDATGFSVCESGADECDKCSKLAPLYFGNQDYWDSREGDYYCVECLRELKESNDSFSALMESQIAESNLGAAH